MKSLLVTSHKGGVGCSTVASSIAITSAKSGVKTLLVDGAGEDTLTALLGLPENGGKLTEVTENLWLSGEAEMGDLSDYELIVVDAGMSKSTFGLGDNAERLGVVKNCYLSLKRAVKGVNCDSFICVEEQGRALNTNDAQSVLGRPVTRVLYEEQVSRAVDAGLFIDRNERFSPWAREILETVFA